MFLEPRETQVLIFIGSGVLFVNKVLLRAMQVEVAKTTTTKGMYRRRSQKAWGHTAHRGWACLLLDRARDSNADGRGQPRQSLSF